MYALIEFKGKQYKVEKGSVFKSELVEGEVGTKLDIDSVLLVSSEEGADIKIGSPYVSGAKVSLLIEEHGRAKKIIVFKYKPKKDYRRKKGHRQWYSVLRVEDISA
jgi:large subunit ribosomal protein L21